MTEDLVYEEHPVQILGHNIRQLRHKQIPLVKVHYANHTASTTIWQTEEEIKAKYPHLFEVTLLFNKSHKF